MVSAASGAGSTSMTGAQFEIRIDGTPRTYRDRRDFALEAARLIKSKNPHSLVEVKDLKAETLAALTPAVGSKADQRGHRISAANDPKAVILGADLPSWGGQKGLS